MHKITLSLLLFFNSVLSFSQIVYRYEIERPANLVISSISFKNEEEISAKLSSGETVQIIKQHLHLKMIVKGKSNNEILKEVPYKAGEKNQDEITLLELYEYDFDSDGEKELLVITSLDANSFNSLEIYKHNAGFVKKVGNFSMGISASFDKNLLSVYSGIRDSHINFLYLDNQFWKLNWHNPNGEEE